MRWFGTRVRRLLAVPLLLFGFAAGAPAPAADLRLEQLPGPAANPRLEKLPAALAERQAAYLTKVEASAAEKFGKDTTEYYAALRQGLVRLGAAFQGHARGEGASFETMPTQIDRPVLGRGEEAQRGPDRTATARLDRTTIARIERDFAAAKVGARVVGGEVITTFSEFRDTVAFGRANNLGCSGVVIHANSASNMTHVLTAAHCVCSLGLQGTGADNTKLYVGTNVSDTNQFVALDFANKVFLFPGSSCSGTSSIIRGRDLAVVRFKNNKPQANIRVATIAASQRLQSVLGDPLAVYQIVGFGYQREQSEHGVYKLGDIGQKAFGYITRGADCTGTAAMLPGACLRGEEITLSDSGNRVDTCAGDSGGPVYVRDSNFTSDRLVAITSRSSHPSGACGPGGRYGIVDQAVVGWLQNTVNLQISLQN